MVRGGLRPTPDEARLHACTNPDGSAIADADFDPEREFNTFVPADACTVLTTY